MGDGVDRIHEKIRSFQKKYYLNIFIRGAILTVSIVLLYFLLAAVLEYNFWMQPWARFTIFVSFFGVVIYCIYHFLKEPLQWWIAKRGMGQEESARIIGGYFPEVKDRLLNLLQLTDQQSKSALAYASIRQKSVHLEPLSFESIVDLNENRKYLKFLLVPFAILLVLLAVNQQIITNSTTRILKFTQEFSPAAPFSFEILNESLIAFHSEDYSLNVKLAGTAVPENAYLVVDGQRFKMQSSGGGSFSYNFENVQEDFTFQLEAAGFYSSNYTVDVVNRPELTGFQLSLDFPNYTGRKDEVLNNAGNIEVPEGTTVQWNIAGSNTLHAGILFQSSKESFPFLMSDNEHFKYSRRFLKSDGYEIILKNNNSENRERISYRIDVVKDQFPQIAVNSLKDSILYRTVVLGGMLSDDYGLTELALFYKIKNDKGEEKTERSARLSIVKDQAQQSFIFNWPLDSLQLKAGDQLEYYLKVWDNDAVNGRKATRSATYNLFMPTEGALLTDINKTRSETQQKMDQSAGKADKLQEQIDQAAQRLKGKQSLDWQDKKMLQDIVQQKNNLDQMLDQLKEQNNMLQQKKEAFTEQDERIKEKAEQIQKLLNELLDEETKKLFEELQKLLKENADVNQLQKLLEKLNQNTSNLEKELDRILELFKEIEFESKVENTVEKLKSQIEEQKKLIEKTQALEQKNKSAKGKEAKSQNADEAKDLAEEQAQLKEKFDETSQEMEELKKMAEELNKPEQAVPGEEEREGVKEEQQKSQEMLEQNEPGKSQQNQQKALEQMQQMQEQMESMQSSMSMEMDMQNLEALRQIIHGLIKLSFDQEGLIKSFQELQSNDPQFNTLAQKQLKLKDDSKVLEDSLMALGKRDPYMGSFISKEVTELNNHLEKVNEANKERRRPQALSEMQMSMTSINNLALMLDSHFDMMMQMMANAKPSSGKGKQKGKTPNLSQMQQNLNNKIQELKNSGKSGRQLSEELAEMAAEQERIRRALEEMQQKLKENGVNPGGDLPSKMEQTELDLVNKQLTDQLVKRQQDILTRLLETEKSMREQEMDDERKGETAKDYEKEIPKAFEDYLRLKEKEVELLKTVPPKLYPYYKKEVNEYFKRMGN